MRYDDLLQIYEYCEQGNLLELLNKKGSLQEKEALTIFRDLVMAIRVLYNNSIPS